ATWQHLEAFRRVGALYDLELPVPPWASKASVSFLKINGVKRHIATDTQGLLLNAIVHPANVQDRDGAIDLLKQLKKLFPGLKLVWADNGYNAHKLTQAFTAT